MLAILDHVEPVAANVFTFWFRPDHPVRYVAGQYTQLYLPHAVRDDRGDKRWFTLSSSPTEPLLGITTKFADRGSTFKRTLRDLVPGTQVRLAEPMGDFVLPKDPRIPLIFAAVGMGVTPVRSMMKYLLDSGEARDVRLLYAVGEEPDLAFGELFRTPRLQLWFSPIVRRPSKQWTGDAGELNTSRITLTAQQTPNALIYLSGPESLVEKLDKELKLASVAPERLVTDFFHGYLDV